MWGLLDQLQLPPVQATLQQLEALAASADQESSSVARQRVLGRLRHDIAWLGSTGAQVCSWLHDRTQ